VATARAIRPVTKLEVARRERGYTQQQLADQAGVPRSDVQLAERGYELPEHRRAPIGEALGADPEDLWPEHGRG
jgi:DNA-binding XRE family transcriptional regulator